MLGFLFGLFAVCALIALPLILIAVVFKVALVVLLVPFRLLGAALHLFFGGAGLLVKLVLGVLVAVAVFVFLPLLPFVLLGLLFVAFVKLLSPPQVVVR